MAEARVHHRVAVVGGDTLLAREIQELLGETKPAPAIELISALNEGASVLSGDSDEAIPLSPLTAESLAAADVAFLAGSPAASRKALRLNPADGPVLIDLTGALEDLPQARLRAPSAEPENALSGRANTAGAGRGAIYIIAHPAAIGIAALLAALARRTTIRRSLIHVFEPASERGKKGLDELQQQTVALLNFQKLNTAVFDAQLGFNMLARYGEEAMEPIEGVEQRVEKNVATLLSAYPAVPMPSLRLIQAPVFHGHSFSLWVEFAENPGAAALAEALKEAGIDVHPDEPPSNAKMAGQGGLSAGAIAIDSNQPRAAWIWAVADNFRLAAENAIAVAKEFLP